MRNKKVIMLTVLFMFLLSSACAAYQPDPHRWEWIYSDDEVGYFCDKQTVRYYDSGDTCDVWIMKVIPATKTYSAEHWLYKKNRTFSIQSYIDYDEKTGKVLDSYTYSYPDYNVIPPGTIAEVIYKHLFYKR